MPQSSVGNELLCLFTQLLIEFKKDNLLGPGFKKLEESKIS